MARSRRKRRGFPIHAYVGPNGHGKSLAMVYDTLPSLDAGRPVLSTVRLLDYRDPRPCPGGARCDDPDGHAVLRRTVTLVTDEDTGEHSIVFGTVDTGEVHPISHPYYVPLRTYPQLLDWRDGDVLFDEVVGLAHSRDFKSMPGEVASLLQQLRRRGIVLRWTAPAWGRADTILREVTQAVTLCMGTFPERAKVKPGEAPRLWGERRVFYWRTFDALLMDEFEARRAVNVEPEVWQWFVRPGRDAGSAYWTLDTVSGLTTHDAGGLCLTCNGKRFVPKCSCPDHSKIVLTGSELVATLAGADVRPEAESAREGPRHLALS
jgi:hypothetical protein